MLTVGPDHDCIDRLHPIVGKLEIVTDHDDGKFRPHLLDFRGHDKAVQQAQVVLDDHCIHRLQHEEPQALMPTGCGHKAISILLQVKQLARIPVDTE
ncbi:MAG TPA: hypothetical protein VNY29_19905 [Terriglobales bacterium]|nr:hypothetical protein [Terriglobales bacterium]